MPFERDDGEIPTRVVRLESWVENADPLLFGTGGNDLGLIREHNNFMAARAERERETDKYNRRVVAAVALLGTAVPLVLKFLELVKVIPR